MRDRNVFGLRACLPRMSWSPVNLYNLWRRSTLKRNETDFRQTISETLFQQRWASKKLTRAYHGDFINEKIFKKYYLPDNLPDVRSQSDDSSNGSGYLVNGFSPAKLRGTDSESLAHFAGHADTLSYERRHRDESAKDALAPVGSLMFREVERRIDVFIFRCCFAESVYEARRLVLHGRVLLNGKKHQNPNTRLAPGDMVSVDPAAISFLRPVKVVKTQSGSEANIIEVEEDTITVSSKAPESNSDTESASTTNSEISSETTVSVESSPESNSETSEPPSTMTPETSKPIQAEVENNSGPSVVPKPKDTPNKPSESTLTPFNLPPYASPFIFIPAYIEVSFLTCSAIYVRHPTARYNYSEIPSPYEADGEVVRFTWEWYNINRSRSASARRESRRLKKLKALGALGKVTKGGNVAEISYGWEGFGSPTRRGKIEPEDREVEGKGLKGFVHRLNPPVPEVPSDSGSSDSDQLGYETEFDAAEFERAKTAEMLSLADKDEELKVLLQDIDSPGVKALKGIRENLIASGYTFGKGGTKESKSGREGKSSKKSKF